jgi:hypothetical protein
MDKIPPGKKVIADKGCRGEPHILSTPNLHDSRTVKIYKNRARARHESYNKRLKDFKMLKEQYRHGISNHIISFEAICVLIQVDLESRPLFEI